MALFLILGLSATKDLFLFTRFDVPAGIDGYYYVIQIRSFLNSGTFYYATHTPLILYLLSLVTKVSGNAVNSIEFTSISLHTILAGSLSALVYSITRSRQLALLSTFISLVSAMHLIWMSEFVKQLGGVSLWLLGFACILQTERRNLWRPIGITMLAASLFAHRSIVLLTIGLLFLALIFFLINRVWHARLSSLSVFAIIIGCLCLPLLLARQRVFFQPQISEAVLFVPRFPITHADFEERLAVLFLAPAGLFLSLKNVSLIALRWPRYAIGMTALSGLLFTLNPFLIHEGQLTTVSERLDLFAYLQVAILLSAFLWLATSTSLRLVILLSVVCLLALGNETLPTGLQRGFLERRQALVSDLSKVRSKVPAQSVIIAPHGDDFLVTFATGAPSRSSTISAQAGDNRTWLLFGAPCRTSENVTVVSMTEACSILVREGFPISITEAEERRVMAMNPHLRRAPDDVIDRVLSVMNQKNPE